MKLIEALQERKEAIVARWRQQVLAAYRADGALFFERQSDRFANPVGHTVREVTTGLFDALLRGEEGASARGLLEDMLRVRAVQELRASTAVGFVLQLKGAIRAEVHEVRRDAALALELVGFEERIDRLALAGFDAFVACREELARVRVLEVERRLSWILGHLNRGRVVPAAPVDPVGS